MRGRNRHRLVYKNDSGKSKGKVVLVTLGLVFLAVVFGVVSLFVLLERNDFDIKKVLGTRTADKETGAAPTDPPSVPAAAVVNASKDEYRYVLLCGDADNGFAFMAEITANINANTIEIEPVSADKTLSYNGQTLRVGEMFNAYSYDLIRCYSENNATEFDKYLSITTANFKKLMAMLGSVTVRVEQDLPYVVDGVTYTFRRGDVSLTSDLLLKYMTATGTGETLLRHQATALCELFRTHFTAQKLTDGESFFSSFISYFKTDINIYDYRSAAAVVYAFAAAKPAVYSDCLDADTQA